MTTNKNNYWLFRVTNKWGSKIDFCLDNNLVYCGWNIGLSTKTTQEVLEDNPESSRMSIKFTYIQEGDYVVMPNRGGIAIGKVLSKQHRPDLEWQDTLNVEWLTKIYSKKDLPSKLQSKLKYRGTFLNLNDFSADFDKIIDSNFLKASTMYQNNMMQKDEEIINKLATTLNNRQNTKFQDTEFERFILHLFELEYADFGANGYKNDGKSESKDGKDIGFTIDMNDLDIHIEVNIQVKQHSGNASFDGVHQISKSASDNVNVRNILVTTGYINDDFIKKALEKNISVYGPNEIARLIVSNIDELDSEYLQKLNIYKSIDLL